MEAKTCMGEVRRHPRRPDALHCATIPHTRFSTPVQHWKTVCISEGQKSRGLRLASSQRGGWMPSVGAKSASTK